MDARRDLDLRRVAGDASRALAGESGELWTSAGAYSFKGITQKNVIDAWTAAGGVAREYDFTLAQVYSADEAFVTGTLGGVTPVTKVDGGGRGRLTFDL